MPLYNYCCNACGHEFDELKSVKDRELCVCPDCGEWAKHRITPASFDPRMGLDPAFSTFSDRWAKKQERKGKGKDRDSNNHRYGGRFSD